jgi:phage tail tape-measure protein
MKNIVYALATFGALGAGACTQTGNVERGAATGAVLGGAAGAIIGNNVGDGDAQTGAAIGAVVGGASGAYAGREADKRNTSQYQVGPNGEKLQYDTRSNRYYYVDARSGRTYWANGEYRG